MSESAEITPPATEINSSHDKLPTNLAIAQQGVTEFSKLLGSTKHWKRGQPASVLFNKRIRNCFLGVSPHVTLSETDSTLGNEIDPGFMQRKFVPAVKRHSSLLLINLPSVNTLQGKLGQIAIVNVKALEYVANNYPEYFPDAARMDPRAWATASFSFPHESTTGGNRDIQMGLLSGYPLGSVLKYDIYQSVIRKVSNLAPDLLFDTTQEIAHNNRKREAAQKVIKELGDELNEQEKDILLIAHALGKPIEGGASLDGDRDNEYLNRLNELYDKSGINETTQKFWEYLLASKDFGEKLSDFRWMVRYKAGRLFRKRK